MEKCLVIILLLYKDSIDISYIKNILKDKIIYVNVENKKRKKMIGDNEYDLKVENSPVLLIHKSFIDGKNKIKKVELQVFTDNLLKLVNIINETII